MKIHPKTVLLAFTGTTLLASLAIAQGQREGRARGAGDPADGRRGAETRTERRADRIERRLERLERARRFVRELDLTDAQRALARQEAQALAPAAKAAREEARGILDAARERRRGGDREGAREQAREQLKGLRERTRAEFTPHGRALIQSLTPEQRARIEARLAERGRTFDAERASERVGRWLAHRAAACAQGQLEQGQRDERPNRTR